MDESDVASTIHNIQAEFEMPCQWSWKGHKPSFCAVFSGRRRKGEKLGADRR